MALSGAERQRRWRVIRVKEIEALEKGLKAAQKNIAELEKALRRAKQAKAKRRAKA